MTNQPAPEKCCPRCGSDDKNKYKLPQIHSRKCVPEDHHKWHDTGQRTAEQLGKKWCSEHSQYAHTCTECHAEPVKSGVVPQGAEQAMVETLLFVSFPACKEVTKEHCRNVAAKIAELYHAAASQAAGAQGGEDASDKRVVDKPTVYGGANSVGAKSETASVGASSMSAEQESEGVRNAKQLAATTV